MFEKGGMSNVTKQDISNSIKGCRKYSFICKNRFNNVMCYSFGFECRMKPSLDNAAKAIEKHVIVNYFLGLEPCIKANDLLKKMKTRRLKILMLLIRKT